jgi:hypothetical protein
MAWIRSAVAAALAVARVEAEGAPDASHAIFHLMVVYAAHLATWPFDPSRQLR